jgi:hypothetical protein
VVESGSRSRSACEPFFLAEKEVRLLTKIRGGGEFSSKTQGEFKSTLPFFLSSIWYGFGRGGWGRAPRTLQAFYGETRGR